MIAGGGGCGEHTNKKGRKSEICWTNSRSCESVLFCCPTDLTLVDNVSVRRSCFTAVDNTEVLSTITHTRITYRQVHTLSCTQWLSLMHTHLWSQRSLWSLVLLYWPLQDPPPALLWVWVHVCFCVCMCVCVCVGAGKSKFTGWTDNSVGLVMGDMFF